MNIVIKGIREPGDLTQERIVLSVSASTDVGEYLLAASSFAGEGEVSTLVRQTFWFPDKPVRTNALVIVYTKKGQANEKVNKNGTTSHFFYWGLDGPVWDEDRAAAVLIGIAGWDAKGRTTVRTER